MAEQAWRPRPCGYAHRRSGSPWVPVRPYYEGLPLMAGRGPDEGSAKAARISAGLRPRVRTRKHGPGVEDAISGAPEGGVPARHAAPQGADYEVAPFGALLPHVGEGREETADPTPSKQQGR